MVFICNIDFWVLVVNRSNFINNNRYDFYTEYLACTHYKKIFQLNGPMFERPRLSLQKSRVDSGFMVAHQDLVVNEELIWHSAGAVKGELGSMCDGVVFFPLCRLRLYDRR